MPGSKLQVEEPLNPSRRFLLVPLFLAACGETSLDVAPGAPDAPPPVVDAPPSPPPDAGIPSFQEVTGWSVRKRLLSTTGEDFFLEEKLQGFVEAAPGASRVRIPGRNGAPERSWSAPATQFLSDACRHPSGEVSAVLVGEDTVVSLVRLAPDLTSLAVTPFHDPDIANDPASPGSAPTDIRTGGLSFDSVRMVCVGEEIRFVVNASGFAVIAYATAFVDGAWAPARRTLVEPSGGITLFLPIGGSFDTFEAITVSQRSFIDADDDGNTYVATYAQESKVKRHGSFFKDGVVPLPGDPAFPSGFHEADVLLTKLGTDGARVWTRVVGTAHEDEPYAIRVRGGQVAVVGRARRNVGLDNTFWDAFIAVTTTDGDPVGTRVLQLDASGIFLAVDGLPDGGWVLGGSDGWSQNPDGLSVLSFGRKLLLQLAAIDATPARIDLPAGPRHNEVRAVIAGADAIWLGGQDDGPIMHTGDGDPSQIHSNGVVGVVPRPSAAR